MALWLSQCSGKFSDIQLHSDSLEDLCLWYMIAQVGKGHKSKDRKLEDTDDEDYTNYEKLETGDDVQSVTDLLSLASRIWPRFELSSRHPEYISHTQKICLPSKRLVPAPIGPSIPRRDQEAVKEQYGRLMLVLFRPWGHAKDLWDTNQSWSEAFYTFMKICAPEKTKVMDSMQILQECKDSQDDHFLNWHSRNCANHLPGVQFFTRVTEEDFGPGKASEELILEHLTPLQEAWSAAVTQAQMDVLTCLHHTETAGLFTSEYATHKDINMDSLTCEEVFEQKPQLEEVWKKTYEDRRQDWKRKAQTHPAANPSVDLREGIQISNI